MSLTSYTTCQVRSKFEEEGATLLPSPEGTPIGHFFFETRAFTGRGHITLSPSNGSIASLFTFTTSLHPSALSGLASRAHTPPISNAAQRGSLSSEAFRMSVPPDLLSVLSVLIVGAGQAGLSLAARFKRLGVEGVLIVEKNRRVGDNWRRRYDSLHLHDPRNACSLPYMAMPSCYPKFVPKDLVADYLEGYADTMSLDVRLETSVVEGGATYDDKAKEWTVQVSTSGAASMLRCRHLVIATGLSGFARIPKFEGSDVFKGSVMHSSKFTGHETASNVVIVGSNTSAHDIAQAMYGKGSKVTMVQRSATTVLSLDSHAGILMSAFNGGAEKGRADPDANDALGEVELLNLEIAAFHSNSYRKLEGVSREVVVPACKANDANLLRGLESAGMKLDWGEDETGLLMKFLRRGSGYYMSIGCSELIAAGDIELVQCDGSEVGFYEGGIDVAGKQLEADLVVACTGYTNMSSWVSLLCGPSIASKVGHVGGYGSGTRDDALPYVGEMRNMWGKTGQEGLWIMAGNFTQCRFYR